MDEYKKNNWYLLWRVYVVAAVIAWNVVGFSSFGDRGSPSVFLLFPPVAPAIFMLFNLGAFRWPYSIFGPFVRTKAPAEPVQIEARGGGGRVGLVSASVPLIAWRVYKSGIGFRMLGTGEGFVSFRDVERVKSRAFGGCKVWHHSSQVRSPLIIFGGAICGALKDRAAYWGYESAA